MRKRNFWPPANEVSEGNVFTGVCLSTRGVECLPLGPGGADTPWADTPLGRHSLLGRYPSPGHTPPSWVNTPLLGEHSPPGWTPPLPGWLLKRVVRIILECILDFFLPISECHIRSRKKYFCKRCSFQIRLVWTTCYNHNPFPNLQCERVLLVIHG